LRTDGGYEFRIETDFVVHAINGDHRVSVEKTGQLTLDFTSGIQVRVEPDENYEAWTFDGPRGEKIVCAPGGELVTWSA
jgi:hypothetical protein